MIAKKLFLLLLFCLMAGVSFSQTKHALIVAIGNYPDPKKNGWPVINSENDLPLIKNALTQNQEFSESNIQVLVDSQATRKGIVAALDKLINDVKKGDIVLIHFSSHGEQIEDDSDDEIDGLDEAIVPYGAVLSTSPDDFDRLSRDYLRDDLFGEKVIQLRNKLGKGGDLLVIIDACHSGSGTRGAETAKVRGGNTPMVSNKFNTKKFSSVADNRVFKESTVTRLSAEPATYVVISGAQARERNFECYDDDGNPVGSLSYSFSKVISSLKGKITYRSLFSMIENIMREKAPNQKPVLEGDGIDRELFGGGYKKQQLYFSINRSQSKVDKIVLNAGFVAGITKGSVINFYEAGTTSTAGKKPINSGKVTTVSSFSSTVKPDSLDDKLIQSGPYAFLSELSYGTSKLKLFVTGIGSVDKIVQEGLKDFQLVEFNKNCDLSLDTSGSVNNWALKYPNSGVIFQDGFSFPGNNSITALKDALKSFARFDYLKGLMTSEKDLSADVQLQFLDDKGNIDDAKLKSRTNFGRLELKEEDKVYLMIINTGNKSFYINVVDIQPNGIINAILPNKNLLDKDGNPAPIKWEDCLVKKGDTLFLRNLAIEISKPYGQETFKVFLSTAALDLEEILTTKTAAEATTTGKRGVLSNIENLFVDSNIRENGTRGVKATQVNTDQNGTVFSLNFQILPQQ